MPEKNGKNDIVSQYFFQSGCAAGMLRKNGDKQESGPEFGMPSLCLTVLLYILVYPSFEVRCLHYIITHNTRGY